MQKKKKDELLKLPQKDETWAVIIRQAPIWTENEEDGEPFRPRFLAVMEASTGIVRYSSLMDPVQISSKVVSEAIYQAIQGKIAPSDEWEVLKKNLSESELREITERTQPYRPTHVLIEGVALAESIRPELKTLGVDCAGQPRIEQADAILESMAEFTGDGETEFKLSAIQGMSAFNVQEFYAAAAGFYKAAPWKWLANNHLIECHYSGDDQPHFVCIMGNGRKDFGISIYEDLESFEQFMRVETDDDVPKLRLGMAVSSVTFVEAYEGMSFADLDEIERLNYPIGAKDAYPLIFKFIRIDTRLEPTFEDVARYSAILRALPQFTREEMRCERALPRPAQKTYDLPDIYGGHTISFRFPVIDDDETVTPEWEEKGLVDEASLEEYLVDGLKKAMPFKVALSQSLVEQLRQSGLKIRNAKEAHVVDVYTWDQIEEQLENGASNFLGDEDEEELTLAIRINRDTVLLPVSQLDFADQSLPLRRELSAYEFLKWCSRQDEQDNQPDDEMFDEDFTPDELMAQLSPEMLQEVMDTVAKLMNDTSPKSPFARRKLGKK